MWVFHDPIEEYRYEQWFPDKIGIEPLNPDFIGKPANLRSYDKSLHVFSFVTLVHL